MGKLLKDDRVVLKAASLQGPIAGMPTRAEVGTDGKLTRIRPYYYDSDFDWESLNPWKIEARGRTLHNTRHTMPGSYFTAYKKRIYSENRVKYPMKRIDWDPKGNRNTQNRGKSKYVRISWDEAAQLVADELLRVREKYGMSAVLSEADMHSEGKHLAPAHGCMNKLLSMLGGYTSQMRNMDSWEGWAWGSRHVWGGTPVGQMPNPANLWTDIAQSGEQLLFWAGDPETTPVGFDGYMASRLSQYIHSLGVKFVYVDPALNWSGAYQADKWIPVIPNTDAALYLGIIHVWLDEGIYDEEYIKTHAVGYEAFFDYVMGRAEDGIAKTPKWASEKCGVPPWTIKALAREWHEKATSTAIGNGGPGIRGPFSTEPARLQAICLSMQGLGKPGRHQAKWLEWALDGGIYPFPHQGEADPTLAKRTELCRPKESDMDMTGPAHAMCLENLKNTGAPEEDLEEFKRITFPHKNGTFQSIPKCMLHDAILKDSIDWWGLYSFVGPADEQWVHYEYPAAGCSKTHMIWTDSPAMVTCWNDGFRFVKAMRSEEIECVVAQHPWLENDCYLADIILPVQTKYEMEDISDDVCGGNFVSVYREGKAIDAIGESLSDFDCVAMVAKKLGDEYYEEYTGRGVSNDRLIDLFYRASGVSHLDTEDAFGNKDIFVLPCREDTQDFEKHPPGLRAFLEDPAANPLPTPTGKLEFTSTKIQELFPDDKERPPYPMWVEKSALHDESLSSKRAEKYPLLCVSNHGRWRFHSQLDDITWNREVEAMKIRGADGYQYESAWINPQTAAERGIAYGDLIKVYNERGTVLCAAYVTERLMPGAVYVDHGARFDPIDAENLDRGGAINLITPTAITSKTVTGMVVSGFLTEAAKVTENEYAEWKEKYPEAFERKIDKGCGVCREGWMTT